MIFLAFDFKSFCPFFRFVFVFFTSSHFVLFSVLSLSFLLPVTLSFFRFVFVFCLSSVLFLPFRLHSLMFLFPFKPGSTHVARTIVSARAWSRPCLFMLVEISKLNKNQSLLHRHVFINSGF